MTNILKNKLLCLFAINLSGWITEMNVMDSIRRRNFVKIEFLTINWLITLDKFEKLQFQHFWKFLTI